jgi:hypothetical protein
MNESSATHSVWVGQFGVYPMPDGALCTKKGLLDKRHHRYHEMVDWIDAQEASEAGVTVEQLRKAGHGAYS